MSAATQTAPQTAIADVDRWLADHESKELLRVVTVGSVDDGKSTLIGRLLFDTGNVPDDQLEAISRASRPGEPPDLSLLTDGLAAEREQGITIDVAYRYLTTRRRKVIVADTPGHFQYTRNMVTGASTANVAVILIDARHGLLEQSRRHAFIASLLGIPHLVVCVNKMDLVAWDRAVFEGIASDFRTFAAPLAFREVTLVPVSALTGANVARRADEAAWYDGPTVLETLESVPVLADRNLDSFRFPVQLVIRPNLDYRGFAGQIASGAVRVGDEVVVLPSMVKTTVKAIDTYEGPLSAATTPQSVTLRLSDEVDLSRGEMLVHPDALPHVGTHLEAHLVWMHPRPLEPSRSYLVKQTTRTVRAQIEEVLARQDLQTLTEVPAEGLALNEIGRVRLACHRPLFFDAYAENRATGAFIVIDPITNDTVAAGMLIGPVQRAVLASEALDEASRAKRLGQVGGVVWSSNAAGSVEAARQLEALLAARGVAAIAVVGAEQPGEVAYWLRRAGHLAIVVTAAPPPDSIEGCVLSAVSGDELVRLADKLAKALLVGS